MPHQLEDLGSPLRVALECLQRRDLHDRDLVARELIAREQLAHLDLDKLEQLGVVDHVGLVEGDDDRRHFHLAGEQDVLAGLRHRAIGGRDDQDRAVHLGGAGDHVLDVVGMPRAVDVRVVTVSVSYSTCEVLMVIPRCRSSGALSIELKSRTSVLETP